MSLNRGDSDVVTLNKFIFVTRSPNKIFWYFHEILKFDKRLNNWQISLSGNTVYTVVYTVRVM